MTKEQLVNCNICKQKLIKSSAVKDNNKNVHKECLEEKIRRREEKENKAFIKKHTCPVCNTVIYDDEEDKILISNIYYHNNCYKYKENNNDERKKLLDYLDKLHKQYGLVFNKKIFAQIKYYHNSPDYKFRYKGMLLTLIYYIEILGNDYKEDTFGLIPYYYDEAKNYEIKKRNIQKYINSLEKPIEIVKKTITIPTPKLHNRLKERIETFDPTDPDLCLSEGENGIVDDIEIIKKIKEDQRKK